MCSTQNPEQPSWSTAWLESDDHSDVFDGNPPLNPQTRANGLGLRSAVFDPPPEAIALLDAARALTELDSAALTEDQLFAVVDALEQSERFLTAASMKSLIAIDDRCGFDQRFGMTPGAYSEQRLGRDRLSWARRIRIGRTLAGHLPDIHQALCDGRVSIERANVIANAVNNRNAPILTEAQAELLELSDSERRFAEFKRQVQALAALADADGPDPSDERSKGRVSRTGDHVAIVMDLYGTDAVAAQQMLDAHTDRLWRTEHDEAERIADLIPRSRAELRAAAFLELIGLGAAADAAAHNRNATELSLVIDADRVDDLDPMLAALLAQTAGGTFTGPMRRRGHLPWDTDADPESCGACGDEHHLPPRFAGAAVTVSTPDGDRLTISAQQWQLLLCDSTISQTLLDALGEPIAVRGLHRFADPTMRRALTIRDGGCVFPGCDAPPSWCDAHHVIEWADDGRTVIINLALLCRRHHGIIHRTGWQMTRSDQPNPSDGFFTITTAGGCELPTQHRPRPTSPPPPGRTPAPV